MNITTEHLNFLRDGASRSSFLSSLFSQYCKRGTLSDKQVAAIDRCIATDAVRVAERERVAASGTVCPEGDATIVGTVVTAVWREGKFGAALKLTITSDDGYTAYGTAPAALVNVTEGERVSIAAFLTPKDSEPTFGYFSRKGYGRKPAAILPALTKRRTKATA